MRGKAEHHPGSSSGSSSSSSSAYAATGQGRLAVVIPALNESASITAVLSALRQKLPHAMLLVVDDRSEDDTAARAREAGAQVLPLTNRLGAWGATQTGIRMALRRDAQLVITMDADGQHRGTDIPRLLAPLHNGSADVAIGTCTARGSAARRLAWRMLRVSSGIRMEDLTSGFRAYDRRASELLAGPAASLLDYQDIGVLTLLLKKGLRVVEVDVDMVERENGKSRVFNNWLRVGWYMAHTLLLGLTKRRIRAYRSVGTWAPCSRALDATSELSPNSGALDETGEPTPNSVGTWAPCSRALDETSELSPNSGAPDETGELSLNSRGPEK